MFVQIIFKKMYTNISLLCLKFFFINPRTALFSSTFLPSFNTVCFMSHVLEHSKLQKNNLRIEKTNFKIQFGGKPDIGDQCRYRDLFSKPVLNIKCLQSPGDCRKNLGCVQFWLFVGSQVSDIGYQMSEFGCWMMDMECLIPGVE